MAGLGTLSSGTAGAGSGLCMRPRHEPCSQGTDRRTGALLGPAWLAQAGACAGAAEPGSGSGTQAGGWGGADTGWALPAASCPAEALGSEGPGRRR